MRENTNRSCCAKDVGTLDLDYLRGRLDYDPITGIFTHKKRAPRSIIGNQAGSVTQRGYIVIRLKHRNYLAHRLAFFHYYGKWPALYLDHINGDLRDNRLVNLREASHAENMCNKKMYKNNTGKLKGVYKRKNGRYQATIQVNGTLRYLGNFGTAEEASASYRRAAEVLHGDFAFYSSQHVA